MTAFTVWKSDDSEGAVRASTALAKATDGSGITRKDLELMEAEQQTLLETFGGP